VCWFLADGGWAYRQWQRFLACVERPTDMKSEFDWRELRWRELLTEDELASIELRQESMLAMNLCARVMNAPLTDELTGKLDDADS